MINLLSLESKRELLHAYRVRTATYTLLFGGILLLLASGMALPSYFALGVGVPEEAEEKTARTQAPSLGDARAELRGAQTLVRALTAPPAAAATPVPTQALGTILSARAKSGGAQQQRVLLGALHYGRQAEVVRVDITGTATTRESLRGFIAALEESAGVHSVESPVSNFLADTFRISVIFQ